MWGTKIPKPDCWSQSGLGQLSFDRGRPVRCRGDVENLVHAFKVVSKTRKSTRAALPACPGAKRRKKPRRLSPSGPFIGLRFLAFRYSYNARQRRWFPKNRTRREIPHGSAPAATHLAKSVRTTELDVRAAHLRDEYRNQINNNKYYSKSPYVKLLRLLMQNRHNYLSGACVRNKIETQLRSAT
jgi:hypothetical protein